MTLLPWVNALPLQALHALQQALRLTQNRLCQAQHWLPGALQCSQPGAHERAVPPRWCPWGVRCPESPGASGRPPSTHMCPADADETLVQPHACLAEAVNS